MPSLQRLLHSVLYFCDFQQLVICENWAFKNQSRIPCPPSAPRGPLPWKPLKKKKKKISNHWPGLIHWTPDVHGETHANICLHLHTNASATRKPSLGVSHAPCCNWKPLLVAGIESQLIFCDLSWIWIYYFLTLDAWPTYSHTDRHTYPHCQLPLQ